MNQPIQRRTYNDNNHMAKKTVCSNYCGNVKGGQHKNNWHSNEDHLHTFPYVVPESLFKSKKKSKIFKSKKKPETDKSWDSVCKAAVARYKNKTSPTLSIKRVKKLTEQIKGMDKYMIDFKSLETKSGSKIQRYPAKTVKNKCQQKLEQIAYDLQEKDDEIKLPEVCEIRNNDLTRKIPSEDNLLSLDRSHLKKTCSLKLKDTIRSRNNDTAASFKEESQELLTAVNRKKCPNLTERRNLEQKKLSSCNKRSHRHVRENSLTPPNHGKKHKSEQSIKKKSKLSNHVQDPGFLDKKISNLVYENQMKHECDSLCCSKDTSIEHQSHESERAARNHRFQAGHKAQELGCIFLDREESSKKLLEISQTIPKKKSKTRKYKCYISSCHFRCKKTKSNKLKSHVFDQHLPRVFDDYQDQVFIDCLELHQLRLEAMQFLARCYVDSPDLELVLTKLQMTNYTDRLPENDSLSTCESSMMAALCDYAGWCTPKQFTFSPLNSPALILHWRVAMLVVQQLTQEKRESFFHWQPYHMMSPHSTDNPVPSISYQTSQSHPVHAKLQKQRDQMPLKCATQGNQMPVKQTDMSGQVLLKQEAQSYQFPVEQTKQTAKSDKVTVKTQQQSNTLAASAKQTTQNPINPAKFKCKRLKKPTNKKQDSLSEYCHEGGSEKFRPSSDFSLMKEQTFLNEKCNPPIGKTVGKHLTFEAGNVMMNYESFPPRPNFPVSELGEALCENKLVGCLRLLPLSCKDGMLNQRYPLTPNLSNCGGGTIVQQFGRMNPGSAPPSPDLPMCDGLGNQQSGVMNQGPPRPNLPMCDGLGNQQCGMMNQGSVSPWPNLPICGSGIGNQQFVMMNQGQPRPNFPMCGSVIGNQQFGVMNQGPFRPNLPMCCRGIGIQQFGMMNQRPPRYNLSICGSGMGNQQFGMMNQGPLPPRPNLPIFGGGMGNQLFGMLNLGPPALNFSMFHSGMGHR